MSRYIIRALVIVLLVFALTGLVSQLSSGSGIRATLNSVIPYTKAPVELRILPLGDSITEGYGSPDGNGYRVKLEDLLVKSGEKVEFVGTLTTGSKDENHHEGWGGAKIGRIAYNALFHGSVLMHPNVVLLHVGTNDMQDLTRTLQHAVESAVQSLQLLLDIVLCENPTAVVLLAQIIQQVPCQTCVDAFNKAIPLVVAHNVEKGYKVQLVDMSIVGNPEDMVDGLHPNGFGYSRMAEIWSQALQDVPQDWFTPAPPKIDFIDTRTCDTVVEHWYDLLGDSIL